jgi:hypothetical protein|tara:strand:- start:348 stop:1508 length:1161 start_codon:yes stop_codon:yes gene_type:complete
LFTAAIGYALLCVGLDFYIYTAREFAETEFKKRGSLLKNQVVLVLILYLLLTPIIFVFLPEAGIPQKFLWWFLVILIFEHLNQELHRLFIVLSKQLIASTLLFIRQGSWALAIAGLMVLNENYRNLNTVMLLWTSASGVAALIGVCKLHSFRFGGWRHRVDWVWIKDGLAVSGAFLIATLALRSIQTIDRFWLESLSGTEIVGAYVLFFGIASTLSVLLDAAVFSFKYPELLSLANSGDLIKIEFIVKKMFATSMIIIILFSIVSISIVSYSIDWLEQPVYERNICIYYWSLSGIIFLSLSMIPHYALYALKSDRSIILSHMSALIFFCTLVPKLSDKLGYISVPIAVSASMSILLLTKLVAYFRVIWIRRHPRSQGDCSGERHTL